ncbi:MAG: RdgB/HAM1 family non-canonical purine NTP pyrophosphatase [Methanomassiliicoccaceae archaeon]|nr:RdgB/HAM1 family non-canonical purine NTP pyrophosphatase [Methanomassiliicoccaceae archaeon]
MRLKVITSNSGKVNEYREALSSFSITADPVKIQYDEIQSSDPEEIVRKGMDHLKASGISDFIIDDSGMFVDSLNGFPGVYSAYVQETIGNAGILKLMENVSDRKAVFLCCIGCNISGKDIMVTGKCDGVILEKEAGAEGFGYDPIFSHDGKRSLAEMPLSEKNNISHRGNAVKLLVKEIEKMIR